jgi:hypothetical protein
MIMITVGCTTRAEARHAPQTRVVWAPATPRDGCHTRPTHQRVTAAMRGRWAPTPRRRLAHVLTHHMHMHTRHREWWPRSERGDL